MADIEKKEQGQKGGSPSFQLRSSTSEASGQPNGRAKSTKKKRGSKRSKDHNPSQGVTLQNALMEELADVLDAERQLVKALPRVAKAAAARHLREAVEDHLKETKEHVRRLEKVFQQLGEKPAKKKCAGMQGILAETQKVLAKGRPTPARDALIIAGAQKVEHYEIATYGTLRSWSNQLGNHEATQLLNQTLDEEKAEDEKLTQISEGEINVDASEKSRKQSTGQQQERTKRERTNMPRGYETEERPSRYGQREGDEYGRFENEGQTRRSSRYEDDDNRSSSRSQRRGQSSDYQEDDDLRGASRGQNRQRDEYGRFEGEGRSGQSGRYDEDDSRGSSRSPGHSQSSYYDEDYGNRRSSGASPRQERDEYGRFESQSRSGQGFSRWEDDEGRGSSRSQSRSQHSSYDDDDDIRRSPQRGQQQERDEYGRFESQGRSGGRSGSWEDDDRRSSRSRGGPERERDEYGRFESAGRSPRSRQDDEDNGGSSRSQGSASRSTPRSREEEDDARTFRSGQSGRRTGWND